MYDSGLVIKIDKWDFDTTGMSFEEFIYYRVLKSPAKGYCVDCNVIKPCEPG